MALGFMKFKFNTKTKEKSFCRYRIISNNPYNEKQAFKGKSIRHYIKQKKNNEDQFVYDLNNEYILTFNKIKDMPVFKDGIQLELVNDNELFPLTNETIDLYNHWIEYFVYNRIKNFCKKKPICI